MGVLFIHQNIQNHILFSTIDYYNLKPYVQS